MRVACVVVAVLAACGSSDPVVVGKKPPVPVDRGPWHGFTPLDDPQGPDASLPTCADDRWHPNKSCRVDRITELGCVRVGPSVVRVWPSCAGDPVIEASIETSTVLGDVVLPPLVDTDAWARTIAAILVGDDRILAADTGPFVLGYGTTKTIRWEPGRPAHAEIVATIIPRSESVQRIQLFQEASSFRSDFTLHASCGSYDVWGNGHVVAVTDVRTDKTRWLHAIDSGYSWMEGARCIDDDYVMFLGHLSDVVDDGPPPMIAAVRLPDGPVRRFGEMRERGGELYDNGHHATLAQLAAAMPAKPWPKCEGSMPLLAHTAPCTDDELHASPWAVDAQGRVLAWDVGGYGVFGDHPLAWIAANDEAVGVAMAGPMTCTTPTEACDPMIRAMFAAPSADYVGRNKTPIIAQPGTPSLPPQMFAFAPYDLAGDRDGWGGLIVDAARGGALVDKGPCGDRELWASPAGVAAADAKTHTWAWLFVVGERHGSFYGDRFEDVRCIAGTAVIVVTGSSLIVDVDDGRWADAKLDQPLESYAQHRRQLRAMLDR